MGVRQPSVSSTTIQNATIVTTAETAILQSPPINLSVDSALLMLFWQIAMTSGASVTALVFKLRRGIGVAGAQVGQSWQIPASASVQQFYTGTYSDTPGIVAGQQYTVTVTQTGATGNGSVQDCCINIVIP